MLPTQAHGTIGLFDRFADVTARFVSRAPFFAACLAAIVIWPISFLFFDPDTAQLLINTGTTIVTFLLVALLQNTQYRSDRATQHKLNAIADALADLMNVDARLDRDEGELRAAVGLEDHEASH